MAIAIGGAQELGVDLVVRTRTGYVFHATEGMPVLGADGVRVGRLKQVRLADVLVDRALQRNVYVPFEAIADLRSDGIPRHPVSHGGRQERRGPCAPRRSTHKTRECRGRPGFPALSCLVYPFATVVHTRPTTAWGPH